MDIKMEYAGKTNQKESRPSSIPDAPYSFTANLLKEATSITKLLEQLSIGESKSKFERSYSRTYKMTNQAMLHMAKLLSSFLGSIGNARELFVVLSSASNLSYDQHSSMIDSHPLLADGIPNARHESLRSAHYASSCCEIATMDEYKRSRNPTRGVSKAPSEEEKLRDGSQLQQTFQIQVNNEFIDNLERTAARCLFSVLAILTNTHPASDAFVTFSPEEIRHLDVAAILRPGTLVAVSKGSISSYYTQAETVEYGYCKVCDRSSKTLIVEFATGDGIIERQVSWCNIQGMEDTSKRESILSHHAAAKSTGDLDREPTSVGHLILALRWSRQTSDDGSIRPLSRRIADRVAILLSAELVLHDELNKIGTTDEERKLNAQLLDLFETAHNTESIDVAECSVKQVVDDRVLNSVQAQLCKRLEAAATERVEEQKLWEQQNSGWENSFWGDGHKREGRRSPFRAFNRMSSMDSTQ
jgi:hypothetical protein